MKIKVEVLVANNDGGLQKAINDFLATKGDGWVTNLIDIKLQVSSLPSHSDENWILYTAMIIYKEL